MHTAISRALLAPTLLAACAASVLTATTAAAHASTNAQDSSTERRVSRASNRPHSEAHPASEQRGSHAVHVGRTRLVNGYWTGSASYINTDGHYRVVCAHLMLDKPREFDDYLTGSCIDAVRGVRHHNPPIYPCKNHMWNFHVHVWVRGIDAKGAVEQKRSNSIRAKCG
ncbi:hypothetical protein [Actinomadura sp. 9N215]|uniref:hypothetical protein n=1 Tax=Actinomadura sp. 9N215 TaxID=3375150 RepID=UPI0037997339